MKLTIKAIKYSLIVLLALPLLAQAKTLKMAYDADPVSLDPHEQLSGGTLQISHLIFDPLVRYDQNIAFEPRLATGWQSIDDLTLRVNLRKGVRFHSGNPLTSEDVKWTIERLKRSQDFKAIFDLVSEVKIINEYTFDIITSQTAPLLLSTLTYVFPMDRKFYTGTDSNGKEKDLISKTGSYANKNASGTGPFIVLSRQQGVKVLMRRFSDYWDTASPGNVSEIVFTPIKENATRVAALLSGDVDFIAPIPPSDYQRIQQNKDTKLVTLSGTRIITFQLNQKRKEELADVKVRQAIVYAVNNVGIVEKIMRGYATPAAQFSPKGYLGHNPKLKPRYDLAKAKRLMKEAGYENGFSVTMMAPNNRYVNDEKIAQAVASMLEKINIKVDLVTMPKAQYWPKFDERAADIMMIGWHSDTEDSANFYEFLAMTPNALTGKGQYNSGNYSNQLVDTLTLESLSDPNPERRKKNLQIIEQIIYDEAGFVPLHWQDLSWASRKNVHIEKVINVMNFPYLGDLVID